MIYLAATTDKFQVVTSAAATVDVNCNWIDAATSTLVVSGSGNQNAAITTATTTDILAAPAASTTRTLKQMSIRNKDSTNQTDVTFQLNANGTIFEIHRQTILPGDMLMYIDGIGFFTNHPAVNTNQTLTAIEPVTSESMFQSAQSAHSPIHTFA